MYELFVKLNTPPPFITIMEAQNNFIDEMHEHPKLQVGYRFPAEPIYCFFFETEDDLDEMQEWFSQYQGYPEDESIPGWLEDQKWVDYLVRVGDPEILMESMEYEDTLMV